MERPKTGEAGDRGKALAGKCAFQVSEPWIEIDKEVV